MFKGELVYPTWQDRQAFHFLSELQKLRKIIESEQFFAIVRQLDRMYLGHIGTELANALELRRKTEVLEFIFFDQSTTFQENIDLDRTLSKTSLLLKTKTTRR